MRIINLVSTSEDSASAQVITSVHQLMFILSFRGRKFDGSKADIELRCFEDFERALQGGKLKVEYSNPSAGQSVTLCPDKSLCDVSEIWASINGQPLNIEWLSDQTIGADTFSNYQATFCVDVSDGTVKFGRDNTLNVSIEGIKPSNITGLSAPGLVVVTVHTELSNSYSSVLKVLTPLVTLPEQITDFDTQAALAIFLPSDTDNLHMFAHAGMDLQIEHGELDQWVDINMPKHITVSGLDLQYFNWLAFPLQGFRNGNFTLLETNTAYLLNQVQI